MTDLGELYQQVILDHNRNPRNFKRLESANRRAEGNNPLCGDRIHLYVQVDGDTISGHRISDAARARAARSPKRPRR